MFRSLFSNPEDDRSHWAFPFDGRVMIASRGLDPQSDVHNYIHPGFFKFAKCVMSSHLEFRLHTEHAVQLCQLSPRPIRLDTLAVKFVCWPNKIG